ncbi:UDP-N-acetylglucosamine 2-epimerase [Paenibacillus sp. NFR01]|uniref:UDP-N-acetylglucosamine 2-epimerase n=1 Tax=Paenibacillus sp. NFR01 TaxID=1566279 RepID=UPI0008C5D78E|nr:UDP-N-acetylglucosamine 2-epimerase [Paenibacillus sp. NFR01]SEU14312.1 GDP/UDP-N,N'-diacetylbacillosamine 2-epimerase (hydrolysing) [Paenibacillus sp. NFR01]
MKKVCVVTATRAEYGLLRPLMLKLKEAEELSFQLIVTGTHLETGYGHTVDEIIGDGFEPDALIPILEDATPSGILTTMGNAITKIGEALNLLRPDLLILLGDRYETLAVASAAAVLSIPVAHLYGGEVTYGAYDEMFRHAISKLSRYHFTSTEAYRHRIIQMGESPDRVFNVGALGVENVLGTPLLSKEELEKQLQFSMDHTLLATFHPVTMETMSQSEQFEALLEALEESPKYSVLFTRPNADTFRDELNDRLEQFAANQPGRVKVVDSLGVLKYLSAMKFSAGVIGNSSSGIIETPSMRVGTINIGNRQRGRISAESVIHVQADKQEIKEALRKLESTEFISTLQHVVNPYEGQNTSLTLVSLIHQAVNNDHSVAKEFYDLVHDCEGGEGQ